jgi:hypothetical protein
MNRKILIIAIPAMMLLFGACKKDVDNPDDDSAHGVITTFSIKFSQAGVVKYEAIFDDPDGPGGANPIRFDEILLAPGQTYQASITLTNKLASPATDMTSVIKANGHQHLFVYIPSNLTGLTVTPTDTDRFGFPIGLETEFRTPPTNQTGVLQINLRHIAAGKTASSGPNSGSSDLSIEFATKFQ